MAIIISKKTSIDVVNTLTGCSNHKSLTHSKTIINYSITGCVTCINKYKRIGHLAITTAQNELSGVYVVPFTPPPQSSIRFFTASVKTPLQHFPHLQQFNVVFIGCYK